MARQPIRIRVEIPDFLAENPKGRKALRHAGRNALEAIVGDADGPIKRKFNTYAPKRSGEFSTSLKRHELKRWRKYRGEAGNTCRSVYEPVGKSAHNKRKIVWFQEWGISPTQGRFVPLPAMGRGYGFRIKGGMHPGFTGKFFMAKIARETSREMPRSIAKRLAENLSEVKF